MEASAWQTKLSSFKERNMYAYDKSLFFDVELSVMDANGDKVTIPAHKYVLAISSPVFEAMFYGELAETGRTIELPECTKEGLQEMLRYVYSDEVNLTGSNVLEVLYVAEKYMLPFLKEKCEEYLEKELKPEDVFYVLPQIRNEKVEQKCWDILDNDAERAVYSEAFLNISKEMLCKVLGRDTMSIDEVVLFQAVEKWALNKLKEKGLEENRKNKRAVLGEEVIKLIRFPLMSETEFAEKVLPCGILKMDEVTEVIRFFKKLALLTSSFSNTIRGKCKSNNYCFTPNTRFDSLAAPTGIGSAWAYTSTKSDAIDFKVNKPLSLAGITLFGSNGSTYTVSLSLYKSDEKIRQVCTSIPIVSKQMSGYHGLNIMLGEPVPLEPNVVYTIEAKISGPSSYYGHLGKTTVHFEDIVITYLNSNKSTNSTTAQRGQFHSLAFKRR
ncbi:BTB/POZ domain-containing protein 6-B-like [Actinia tenebrosa]|uniref:BTB/POZ domain-containing protein 6-B-like n=1 Tax=Actinia tenebrosa TaxID=6105 RepID=A0A6P8I3G8_ACTTE|nr:BTB/POZ domain-containing protein 6-B-like [Actinia tenebrosa]